jgi:hypothetical protein
MSGACMTLGDSDSDWPCGVVSEMYEEGTRSLFHA